MGTDNLFHKRKAKNAGDLVRRKGNRETYSKVLIVCEGEKTEPNYFNGLKDYYALNSANIKVCGECGSDPLSIIKYGKQLYREERDAGDAFDKVYCVFDKDSHPNYPEAMSVIKRATPKDTFIAINSVPCFEYWLLLHFNYTTRSYMSLPGNSVCNQVMTELKAYMPVYAKGQRGVFAALIGQLDFAMNNARRVLQDAERHGADNPSTRVHELVGFLRNIKG